MTDREAGAERWIPFVISIANRFSRAGADREELIQCGTVGLLKALERYDKSSDASFTSYAFKFVEGEMLSWLRKNKAFEFNTRTNYRELINSCVVLDAAADPLGDERIVERIMLTNSINRLDETERTVIRLRYMQDLTQVKTAELLETSQSNISKIEANALKKLRTEFEREYAQNKNALFESNYKQSNERKERDEKI